MRRSDSGIGLPAIDGTLYGCETKLIGDYFSVKQRGRYDPTRGPPSAKKIIARSELCGTQRVKKLHSRISAASSLLHGHRLGGEKLRSRICMKHR